MWALVEVCSVAEPTSLTSRHASIATASRSNELMRWAPVDDGGLRVVDEPVFVRGFRSAFGDGWDHVRRRQPAAPSSTTNISKAISPSANAIATPTMMTIEPRLSNAVMRRQIGVETRRCRVSRQLSNRSHADGDAVVVVGMPISCRQNVALGNYLPTTDRPLA